MTPQERKAFDGIKDALLDLIIHAGQTCCRTCVEIQKARVALALAETEA